MEVRKMSVILVVLGFVLLIGVTALGKIHTRTFVIMESNYTRLCSTKSMLTVNGRFPGPAISVRKGDTVIVSVINQGNYNITLHWHGVKQPRNPWSDGPVYVTQCPIIPGANFTYRIIFSTEEGTLWWHAHSDWSRATVHGAIIIRPIQGTTYPFPTPDAEMPIILGSWYRGDVMEVIEEALAGGGEPNISDAFTINGQPGDLYPCSRRGTFRMRVDFGKSYLLRIINAVMNEEVFFSIAQHNLTVVGTDGTYTKRFTTSYIMITPGQTMDVLLQTNQSLSRYYMAVRAYSSGVGVAFDNTTGTAILQYRGNYTPPSSPSLPNLPFYNDTDAATNFTNGLNSLANNEHPVDVPQTINTRIITTVSVNTFPCANNSCAGPNGSRLLASMNNISFVDPSIDLLQAYYRSIRGVFTRDFPNTPPFIFNFTADSIPANLLTPNLGTRVRLLQYNSSVEIVLQGTNLLAGENHPMHLHGHGFYVVGKGFGNFDRINDPRGYNLVDPIEENTVGVPKNGWAAIRFRADNPGVWFMHCHLDRHNSWGMNTVFIVRNGRGRNTTLLPPPPNMPPC